MPFNRVHLAETTVLEQNLSAPLCYRNVPCRIQDAPDFLGSLTGVFKRGILLVTR